MPRPPTHVAPPLLVLLTLSALLGGGAGPVAAHDAEAPTRLTPGQLQGLQAADAGPCAGGYRLVGTGLCTHGPDARPAGSDLAVRPRNVALATGSPLPPAVICDGDGRSGDRVQAVYARLADTPNRATTVLPQIRTAAAGVQSAFLLSAARTDGVRRPRWVTNADCSLSILQVTLSESARTSFNATISELSAQGLARSDRKYLVWWDTNVYCGIGTFWGDDRPTTDNLSNRSTGYARVDTGCWGWAESHELMHTLGGVQNSAPHTTYGLAAGAFAHCIDEYDIMCYPDAAGVTMTVLCPDHALDGQFDCGNDDYFDTDPAPGSYLGSHWNTADSGWLAHTVVELAAPTPRLAVRTTVSAGRVAVVVPLTVRAPLAGLEAVAVQRRDGQAAWIDVDATGDGTTLRARLVAGRSTRFRTRSVDADATPGPWRTGVAVVVRTLSDTSGAIRYRGTWRTVGHAGALGGAIHRARRSGAAARLTTAASELGIVAATGPGAGRLEVRVDGITLRTVDLHGPAADRRLVSVIALGGGRHTVELRVHAPRNPSPGWHVDLDALVLLTR